MTSNTVADLETFLAGKGFTLAKEYDNTKGICKVVATKRISNTVIKANNTSRAALWPAYKRALEMICEQLTEYEKQAGKGI